MKGLAVCEVSYVSAWLKIRWPCLLTLDLSTSWATEASLGRISSDGAEDVLMIGPISASAKQMGPLED